MSRSGLPIYFSFFYSHYHCVSFCMVVPNGKTHCLYSETLSSTNVSPCNPTNMSLNEYTRGRQISRQISRSSCASNKSFRSKSSVGYAERMETQSWANQMDVKDSIVKPQMESAQEAMIVPVPTQETSNVPVHEDTSCSTTNINVPLAVDQEETPNTTPSTIPCSTNVLADPNFWDGNFSPIYLFGIDQFLAGLTSRIAMFLEQRVLKDQKELNCQIPTIELFRSGSMGVLVCYLWIRVGWTCRFPRKKDIWTMCC